MRVIYKSLRKKSKLNRRSDERWHLLRTLFTQLLIHERIKTTEAKAKALKVFGSKIIKNAIRSQKIKRFGHFQK